MSGGPSQFSTFFLMTAFLNMTAIGVKINKLQVPEVIKHGTRVVLDCDFTMAPDERELVVKWYFNNSRMPVYQWIPESKIKPRGNGVLKNRLNLEHKASLDANSIHRALDILHTGPDLSGDFTCSVSTMEGEDIRTKSMLVFVPEKRLVLRKISADEGFIRVQCLAEGVFPRPVMSLRSQERDIEEVEESAHMLGHLFEVSTIATIPALPGPEEFFCELRIPKANYTVRRAAVFMPGNGSPSYQMMGIMDHWMTLMATSSLLILNYCVGFKCQFNGYC